MNGPVSGAIGGSAPPEDGIAGSSIGPWRLLRRIGVGGTASVYAAARTDSQFRKMVAVKLIKPGMDAEEILRRFRTERQILAALDHPNITRLLDGGSTPEGTPFIVMEYVEGVPITKYADAQKLSVTDRLNLFRTVCSALQYAHQNLVIHRDLKPANILVTAQGVPKLLDFGIAKLLRPESAGFSVNLTRTRMRMMTPEYSSPEQIRGDPVTTASDVYSLGVVLYELLTHRRPYRLKTDTPGEIERAICDSEPERPSLAALKTGNPNTAEATPEKLSRRLRGDLDAIVLTALRKESHRRYPTVDSLSNDIARHLNGLPVAASTDSWRYRAGKFASRHRVGVALAALVAIVLISATGWSLYFERRALQQKQITLQLGNIILENLDPAVQSGPTQARRDLLDKILESLNKLDPNAADDTELQPLLFRAYRGLGDRQGNIYENNLGSPAASKRSYEHALALARQPVEYAEARLGLGDVSFSVADHQAALAQYLRAESLLEAALRPVHAALDARLERLWQDLARAWYKIGLTQWQIGSIEDATASYSRELRAATQWASLFPGSARAGRELALAEEHTGNAMRQTGRMTEGLAHLQRSLAAYREFRQANPDIVVFRHDAALASLLVAETLRSLGELQGAEENYRGSLGLLDALIANDPLNKQFRVERISTLEPLAQVLYDVDRRPESRHLTESALEASRALVERAEPSPYDIGEYCWILLTTRFEDLHRPREALRLSLKAVALIKSPDPVTLNTLALAWAENGDPASAVATERRALAQIYPPSLARVPGSKAAEIAANLDRFERAKNSSRPTITVPNR